MKARCLICDETDQWESVDEHMHKKQGSYICKSCGFVTYDSILKKEEMREFYRSEKNQYRAAPNVTNEFQQERKNQYHNAFLLETWQKWQDENKSPVVFESGAAYGRFLNYVKEIFPASEVYGTELTTTMRRVAWHKFGIKLDEDFDDSKKYDLISSYKVAEHIPDIDLELRKYAECLSDDGLLYIGVPQWFGSMNCFGVPTWNIADYYHPNHINMWTRDLFEGLLKKVGFEVVKQNHTYYDSVYLCKRNDDLMLQDVAKEDYKEILEKMKSIKKASDFHEAGDYKSAIETYSNFADAYTKHYEVNRAQFHKEGKEVITQFLNIAINACPESVLMPIFAGGIFNRYEMTKEAVACFSKALEMRPNDAVTLLNLAQTYREAGDFNESARICDHIIKVSSQHKAEATTWFLHDISKLPGPWEEKK